MSKWKAMIAVNEFEDEMEVNGIQFDNKIDPTTNSRELMMYKNGVWTNPGTHIEHYIVDFLGNEFSGHRVREMKNALNSKHFGRSVFDWNETGNLVNCKNGMVDPLTGALKPHSPDYYSTCQIPHVYDPNANTEAIEDFLDTVMPDKETQKALLEMVGYLLIPKNNIETIFFLLGPGGTGKTVFHRAVKELLGIRNVADVKLHEMENHKFVGGSLEDTLMSSFDDLPAKYVDDVGNTKMLTGGSNTMTVERKYGSRYIAPQTFRLMFACNSIPEVGEKGDAWLRRMTIFPFRTKVSGTDKEDKNFFENKIKPNIGGLLKLAVEHLGELIENDWKMKETHIMEDEVEAYEKKNDTRKAFFDDRCEVRESSDRGTPKGRLYKAYQLYVGDELGRRPMSKQKFCGYFSDKFETKQKRYNGKRKRCFGGLYLKNDFSTPVNKKADELVDKLD